MSITDEIYLKQQRDQLHQEIDRLERKYHDLGHYGDALELKAKRSQLWDVEERLREELLDEGPQP